jgi:SPP1 gp7 family putative phage head morphogenesis protein
MLKSELNGSLQMQVDALVRENARLITTAPKRISQVLTQHIQQRQMEGVRSDQIVKEIQSKLPHLRRYEIKRIARTEVAKADTAVTRVRAQSIGLNWYVWETSEDQRVRPAHKLMDRVLVNWGEAPAPESLMREKSQGHYHAGNIWNCRCVALPLVRMDEISYPVKVYTAGRIKRLTRRQFALLSGADRQLAA